MALAAREISDRTLDCCLEATNLDSAVSAGMAACSSLAMVGQGLDYRGDDPAEEERLWQQSALLSRIASLTSIDTATIKELRRNQ